MLFCGNLVDESGSRFGADAKQLLPLAGPSADGQYRIQGKQMLAYLCRISRVFKLVYKVYQSRIRIQHMTFTIERPLCGHYYTLRK